MDFWIGDWVRDPESGLTGRYEGLVNGKARIKRGQSYISLPVEKLLPVTEAEADQLRMDEVNRMIPGSVEGQAPENIPFNPVLDLHIETLAPHLKGKQVELILHRQLKEARHFLEKAIENRLYSVVLIHGKGTGALKMEIDHMAKGFKEVYFSRPVHNGGGLEIIFRYR